MKKLGIVERNVIEAKYSDHMSVKEIASDMGRPESTVYKILRRAIESLRACVKRSSLKTNR